MIAPSSRGGADLRLAIVALFFLGLPASLLAVSVSGNASVAIPEHVTTVSATQSLPILNLAVPAGSPTVKDGLVVQVDLTKLQRELVSRQRELSDIQKEQRFRASNKEVRKSSARNFEGPPNVFDSNLATRESDALSGLLAVQTKLSTAQIRAPEDGYVVEHLLVTGKTTKKRKPAFRFVELSEVRVTVNVDSTEGFEFPPGSEVVVSAVAEPERAFRARVESLVTTSEGGAFFTLEPIELPFLALGDSAPVIVTDAG